MLQKILNCVRSKLFIYNVITVAVCIITAITIPKMVGSIKSSADTDITDPADIADANDSNESSIIRSLDKITGDSVTQTDPETREERTTKLQTEFFETDGGYKFWEIRLLDGEDNVIKTWAEIYAEYLINPDILRVEDSGFGVTAGGITRKTGNAGEYNVTVTYSGLTVQIEKTSTTF